MTYKFVDRPPLSFRFMRFLIARRVRGSWHLWLAAQKAGRFDYAVWRPAGSRTRVAIPLQHDAIGWSADLLVGYERQLLEVIAHQVAAMESITLIDCGAHLGLVSALLLERCPNIARVVALEPNDTLLPALQRTVARFPVSAEAVGAAVSNFSGRGKLARPDYDLLDVAMFLVPGDGPVRVITVDSLAVGEGCVLLKIDVEGAEQEVIEGAASTIHAASRCVVVFEAHPVVALRTGRDPMTCVRLLQSIRPFEYLIAETGAALSPETERLFQGSDGIEPWNIVARSLD